MKRMFCFLLIIGLFVFSGFAQGVSKKAVENPLECGLFLAKNEKNEFKKGEMFKDLASVYWKLGRQKDAIAAVESVPDDDYYYLKTPLRIYYGIELLQLGKTQEATPILLRALKNIEIPRGDKNDDRKMNAFLRALIDLGKIREVIDFAESVENVEDQAHVLTRVAEILVEKGQKEKPLEMLSKALEIIDQTKWEDIKLFTFLEIGNVFAKLGEREKAKDFLDKVLASYQSSEFSNIDKDSFNEKIVENYETLKEFDKAVTFLEVNGDLNDSNDLYKLAELNRQAGKKEKADALLIQIAEQQKTDYKNDFVLSKIINDSFKANDYAAALASAKNLDSDYYRWEIVDKFIAQNRPDLATELLNFSLKNAQKIRSNEPESGLMSTSPQMRKAIALTKITEKFVEMKQFGTALQIIKTIEKPYYKAHSLANLAVKQNSKNSVLYLEQALSIFEKTEDTLLDANKFTVWSEVAEGFAKFGQKDKAAGIFTEILKNEDIGDDSSLTSLLTVGFYYERAGLKTDARISSALKQFIKNWEEDN